MFSGYDLRNNENVTTEGAGLYSAHLFSKKAGEVIRKHDRPTPLFIYLAFQSLHKPLQVPDKYARLYQPYGRLTKESRRGGMVTALDEAVRNVTRALKQNKMYRNTVIIFLSSFLMMNLSLGVLVPALIFGCWPLAIAACLALAVFGFRYFRCDFTRDDLSLRSKIRFCLVRLLINEILILVSFLQGLRERMIYVSHEYSAV